MIAFPSLTFSSLRNLMVLSHQVFRMKTHTEQYLHADSHHFPAQKLEVLNTLATRALRVSDENHTEDEKNHLLNVFEFNGYNKSMGIKDFQKSYKGLRIKNEPRESASNVLHPFIQGTADKIARVLRKHDVYSTFKPSNTIRSSLKTIKDPMNLKDMKGVYLIPCSCRTPYIGETGRSINQRIQEHAADIKHCRTCSSALHSRRCFYIHIYL